MCVCLSVCFLASASRLEKRPERLAIGAPISSLAISADDRFLVAGLRDGRVVVATVGRSAHQFCSRTLHEHSPAALTLLLSFFLACLCVCVCVCGRFSSAAQPVVREEAQPQRRRTFGRRPKKPKTRTGPAAETQEAQSWDNASGREDERDGVARRGGAVADESTAASDNTPHGNANAETRDLSDSSAARLKPQPSNAPIPSSDV